MRQIKFRGKRVDNGEWVYGDLNQNPIHYDCQIIENGVVHHSVIRETVGQYTGLKDKNGKEIYECDFLKNEDYIYKVKWNTQQGKWWLSPEKSIVEESWVLTVLENQQLGNGYYSRKDLEVIGNLHDNPELLDK